MWPAAPNNTAVQQCLYMKQPVQPVAQTVLQYSFKEYFAIEP